eukprot:c24911_g13_i2 orf=148-879(-)
MLGLWSALKAGTHIVFLNLDYLLHLPALSFLLFYIFKAVAFPSLPFINVLFNLSVFFFISFNKTDVDNLRSHPTLIPTSNPSTRALREICFAIVSITVPITLNGDFGAAAIVVMLRNFAILAMLGVLAGTVYTVLTIRRMDQCYPMVEESRPGWVDELIRWSADFVHIHIWVAAGAAWSAVLVGPLFQYVLPSCILAKLPVMWRWVAAGVSMGLLPVFFLCVMCTHAALYSSCRTHHKQLSLL